MQAEAKLTRNTMWDVLLERVPGFLVHRNEFLADWETEGEPLPEFNCTKTLAVYCISSYSRGDFETVQNVLDIVDLWLRDGDDDVQELAVVGFIEDLSNGVLHEATEPDNFERFMSDLVRGEWDGIREGWAKLLDKKTPP